MSARGHRLLLSAAFTALALVPAMAQAQSAPAARTSYTRYDALGRVVGTIAPDPDGAGPLPYPASRNTYDAQGNLTKVEGGSLSAWQGDSVAPKDWSGFTASSTVTYVYDVLGRKIAEMAWGTDGLAKALTQYSYDTVGRLECTAVRMNPAAYGSYPQSACVLGVEGSQGPDRITRTVYAADKVLQIRKAVGTPVESAEVTYNYTNNGKISQVIDAEGNRATYQYDNFDRLQRWTFPSPTKPAAFQDASWTDVMATAGVANVSDYEEYGYDANGNRTSLRRRDGLVLTYDYDALNRMTVKHVPERSGLDPTYTRDVYYGYDLRGLQLYARFDGPNGQGITNSYDGFGRLKTQTTAMDATWTVGYEYDANGNRTHVTHPDGTYFQMGYDQLNRLNLAWWNSPAGGYVLHSGFTYDAAGRRTSVGRANSASYYGYDAAGRLQAEALGFTQASGANNVYESFGYNPAGQLTNRTRDNDAYAWTTAKNADRAYTSNGLNQYGAAGEASFGYDINGNLTSQTRQGVTSRYYYDVENRMVAYYNPDTQAAKALLRYDPLGRLYEINPNDATKTTRFIYDGDHVAVEYNTAGTVLRRYMWGPDADEPIVWDEGSLLNCSNTRFPLRDRQGSVIALADCAGQAVAKNRYDEYGLPPLDANDTNLNTGRFQYTGQAWLSELGMYYYKARMYSPTLGRFMQTDPIGYKDQFNLYEYVGNDPVGRTDPTGLKCEGENGKKVCTIDIIFIKYNDNKGHTQITGMSRDQFMKIPGLPKSASDKITRLEGNITKAVNNAFTLNKTVTIQTPKQFGGGSFTANGAERSQAFSMRVLRATSYPSPTAIADTGDGVTTFYRDALMENDHDQRETTGHEMLHGGRGENDVFSSDVSHGDPYNSNANTMIGN